MHTKTSKEDHTLAPTLNQTLITKNGKTKESWGFGGLLNPLFLEWYVTLTNNTCNVAIKVEQSV